MRFRRGLFWYSLGLTLLLLVPMMGLILFFTQQRVEQGILRQAATGQDGVAIQPGSQQTHTVLLAVQREPASFLLLRLDGPAQSMLFCGLPSDFSVQAPSGTTTLAACYETAGPARVAQLLTDTLGSAPDAYFAATDSAYGGIMGSEAAVRFDTAAVLETKERAKLALQQDSVLEINAVQAVEWMRGALDVVSEPVRYATLQAALWAAFARQNPDQTAQWAAAARERSAQTLTDLNAVLLSEVEQTLQWLAARPALTVEYWVPTGEKTASGWQPDAESMERLKQLLA